jgi:hypothetical protein
MIAGGPGRVKGEGESGPHPRPFPHGGGELDDRLGAQQQAGEGSALLHWDDPGTRQARTRTRAALDVRRAAAIMQHGVGALAKEDVTWLRLRWTCRWPDCG